MDVNERIDFASNVIRGKISDRFSWLYPFTTENLKGYMSNFDFNNKRVLTVGSSGDQIINAYIMGAREIVCFDTHPLIEDYFNLKIAAWKSLSYEDFTKFLSLHIKNNFLYNRRVFNKKLYQNVRKFLDGDSLYLWDNLMKKFSGKRIRNRLFLYDEETLDVISQINLYLIKDVYEEYKENLDNLKPTFIHSDLRDVHNYLEGYFDYIMLSNIGNYINGMYDKPLEEFRDNILRLSNFLTQYGVIFFAYLYNFDSNTKVQDWWDIIYHLDKVNDIFKEDNISNISFEGIGSINNKKSKSDMILVYRK